MQQSGEFYYCRPQPLDDRNLSENWTRFKVEFKRRTGVNIFFHDRNWFDVRLKRRPDIVAGLFSPSYAEHFCPIAKDWGQAPWVRVERDNPRHIGVRRFLELDSRGAVQLDADLKTQFTEQLSQSPVLVIRGLPGSGKTVTTLGLAAGLSEPRRRLYYVTLKDTPDIECLWRSVAQRSGLPSLFLLDDAHMNLCAAGTLLERLHPELANSKGKIQMLILLRGLPEKAGDMSDTPEWLVRLVEDDRILDLRNDLARTRALTEHLRAGLIGLSKRRLERLHYVSGGDLLLLDEVLRTLAAPQDIDNTTPARLYREVRERYFGGARRLPAIQRLAAIAQFDVVPLAQWLEGSWPHEERELANPLLVELFAPYRFQFLHASMAEIVLRALLELDVGSERVEQTACDITARELISYLHCVLDNDDAGERLVETLWLILRTRLKLMDTTAETRIKSAVLADPRVFKGIEQSLSRLAFSFLRDCLFVINRAEDDVRVKYTDLVERRFAILFEAGTARSDIAGVRTVGTGLWTLSFSNLDTFDRVIENYGAKRFLELISENGTLSELFRVVQHGTLELARGLVDRLDETKATTLVERTTAKGGSIESFHYALKRLETSDRRRKRCLERLISLSGWWQMLKANGTLNSLIEICNALSAGFAQELVQASVQLGEGDWSGIIRRGQFRNACAFVNTELPTYPSQTKKVFGQALIAEADALAERSDWFDLNTSPIHDLPATSEGKETLTQAFDLRMEAATVADLEGLDFREAVNGIGLLWQERPDLRGELGRRLLELLPPEREWPREKGEISALRILLVPGVTRDLTQETVRSLVQTLRRAVVDRRICEGTHTLPLFLLIWNQTAAWFEKGPSGTFTDALSAKALDILTEIVASRALGRKSNDEKLAVLMLAGLIGFLDPSRVEQMREALGPLRNAKRWLLPMAENARFIPGFFALHGQALLAAPDTVLSPRVRSALVTKAAEYTDRGPAIDALCASLHSRNGSS